VSVLVTNGEQRSALAATRSLGRAGIRMIVAASRQPCLAGVSRYCATAVKCPPPESEPQAFAEAIARAAELDGVALIIPASDAATMALSAHRDFLPSWCALPLPAHDTVIAATDRSALLSIAARLDVPQPLTWKQASDGVTFPAIVKPAAGRFGAEGRWRKPSPTTVRSRSEAERICSSYAEAGLEPIIQEHIPGEGYGVFALCNHGEPLALFAHRRLREKPPEGGVSVLRESIPMLPDLVQPALRLLQALKWRGLAMVEFRRDSRDGKFKLMEINPRIWGSLQLAIDSGVDFPRLLYDLMVESKWPDQVRYRTGVRSRWLMGDLDHLLITLRRRNGATGPALASFLRFWGARYELERADDPLPALIEKMHYMSDTIRAVRLRIPRDLARRSATPVWG